jgi:N-acylneuraminate cytidylyltransferase
MADSVAKPCLAVIPARAGSKRVPRKNVRLLAGQPMLTYTIEAARGSELFDRVVVSTDSPEIAAIAEAAGAEVPFLRSGDLADDFTPVSLVTLDALERLDPAGNHYPSVAQLMPTCPLRGAEDIRASYRAFRESGSASQVSVTRFGWQNPWWAGERDAKGVLHPVFQQFVQSRGQDLPSLFCPTGAVWWASASTLRREKTFHIAGRTGWEIPWDRGVDIDSEDDWRLAELLLAVSAPSEFRP